MKPVTILALAGFLVLSALPAACATTSQPLATPPGTDPGAAKHNAEGIEQYNLSHWNVAKEHFKAAVDADPKLAEAHYNLALASHKLGAHADAAAHLKKAAELAPNNPAITKSSVYLDHVRPSSGYGSGYGYGGSGYGGGGMGGY